MNNGSNYNNMNNMNQNLNNSNNFNNVNNNVGVSNNQMQYDEVVIEKKYEQVRNDSYFDGKVLELLGWKILKGLLIGVTAGIAASWGDCMVINYQLSHTHLNGKKIKFTGSGGDLFVQRFKWIFLTLITFGIYGFWVPVRYQQWLTKNMYFDDDGVVDGESFFDGSVIGMFGINFVYNLLNIISFGFLYPVSASIKLKWLAKHTVISKKKIVFEGSALSLYGNYILWSLLSIVTFGIYSFWRDINILKWRTKKSHIKTINEHPKDASSEIFLAVVISAVILVLSIGVIGFIVSNVNFDDLGNPFGGSSNKVEVNVNDNSNYYYDPYY